MRGHPGDRVLPDVPFLRIDFSFFLNYNKEKEKKKEKRKKGEQDADIRKSECRI